MRVWIRFDPEQETADFETEAGYETSEPLEVEADGPLWLIGPIELPDP